MDDTKYSLSAGRSLAVPLADADALLSACDGTAALLYLYALRAGGDFSPAAAARALKRTDAEIEKALQKLCALGILGAGAKSAPLPQPADDLPEYTAEDISRRVDENGEFRAVVEETQRILGRTLSGADLKTLFGIYDYLRLPAEVIFLLINHCVENTRERLGPGRLPSMRSIEKEAYVWYNREILTLERAEDYLAREKRRRGELADMKHLLQIRDRGFSPTERKYVESWLDMGFPLESVALAYDKTVIKTGGLTWKYMDSILQSWHRKGLHTPAEIDAGDGQPRAPRAQAAASASASGADKTRDDSARLRKLLDRTKNC
ncbi:MAG: DnaD domain protein [Oscillospiraceae bacterium]|jgi:DnaD/phage-associated family protein